MGGKGISYVLIKEMKKMMMSQQAKMAKVVKVAKAIKNKILVVYHLWLMLIVLTLKEKFPGNVVVVLLVPVKKGEGKEDEYLFILYIYLSKYYYT